MRKSFSLIIAITFFASLSLNNYSSIPKTNAASYRNTYKTYGDVNNDNIIDIFDVVSMRQKINNKNYDKSLDFNCDNTVDSTDLTLLNDYVLGKNTLFDAYLYDDADEDLICDMLEVSFVNSNPDSKDTDGDTLTDFEEVVYSNTSPTNKNTRGLAVTDATDDADGDKLTNKEEITANTNPQVADSDMDGINDYDELKKYKTDPNNEDTDNDGIIDGDEIKLGLKPDSDKSDGSTPDNQRTFEHKISASNELLSYVNTEEAPYEVSIDIKAAGDVDKALSVNIGSFSSVSENKHYIGKSVAFSYDEKLKVDNAKIYFKPKVIDGSIENYMLFEFFPETNYLLPVETKYTSDSAYVETNELGTFILVNTDYTNQSSVSVKKLPSDQIKILASENTVGKNDVVFDYELGSLEVAFFVDISGSLTDKLEGTKKSIHDCCQAIFEHSSDAYIEIIGCYSPPDYLKNKFFAYNNSISEPIHTNITSVDEALSNINPISNDNKNSLTNIIWNIDEYKNNLFSSDDSKKYAFIINNSDYSFTTTSQFKTAIATDVRNSLKEIYNSNVHLNFFISENSYRQRTAIFNLKEVCDPYNFGIYSNLQTGYFGNSGFARIYSDAVTDINKISIYNLTSPEPLNIPEEVNRNAFINSLPSSYDITKIPAADANGNINFKDAAVKIGAATYDKNGNLVFKSLFEACNSSVLTRKGFEQLMNNYNTSYRLIVGSTQIAPFSDKILYQDTDGDGIPNKWDASPNTPIDSNFIVVDSLDELTIDDLMSDAYKQTIRESDDSFNSIQSTSGDVFTEIAVSVAAFFGGSSDIIGLVFGKDHKLGKTPIAEEALLHYINGSGKTLNVPLSIAVGTTKCQRMSYYWQLNSFFRMVENTVKPNYSYRFATIGNTNKELWETDYHLNEGKPHQAGTDWWFTIGGGRNALTAEVNCITNSSETFYSAQILYYVYDLYDWSNKETLGALHKCGKARNFLVTGVYPVKITWKKGARYPQIGERIDVAVDFDYDKTKFEGIDDNGALAKAYKEGCDFYHFNEAR